MAQHVLTPSATSFWRRRSFVVAVLVALVAVGVGVSVAALRSTDSSPTIRSTSTPVGAATNPRGPGGAQCTVPDGSFDGQYLLALIASMPDDSRARLATSLSPPVQQLLGNAARPGSFEVPSGPPGDAPTLAGVLSRLSVADRAAVLNELPPNVSAEVAPLSEIAAIPTCSF
jgi:hypothetical protein